MVQDERIVRATEKVLRLLRGLSGEARPNIPEWERWAEEKPLTSCTPANKDAYHSAFTEACNVSEMLKARQSRELQIRCTAAQAAWYVAFAAYTEGSVSSLLHEAYKYVGEVEELLSEPAPE